MSRLDLDDDTIERLARRVADLLADRERDKRTDASTGPRQRLSAAQVAERWQIDREWVYAHADELGAERLGSGPRPRLRFDPGLVAERLAPPDSQSNDQRSTPRSKAR